MVGWGMYYWLVDNWYNWGNVWSWLVYYWGNIWGWLVSWGWMVNWGWLVNWSWSMVGWGMYYWLVDNWYNWGNVWSWLVYYWGNIWGWLVNWGWVINWSRFVNWGWVVWGWFVNWNMSRSMNGSTVFFSSIWIVYVLWSSMGLARYSGMVS